MFLATVIFLPLATDGKWRDKMRKIMSKFSIRNKIGSGCILLAFLLVGCLETTGDQIGSFLDQAFKIDEPEVVIGTAVKQDQIPWHIQSTVAATVSRLQGNNGAEVDAQLDIIGSEGIQQDQNTNFENFAVANILINDFFQPDDAPGVYRLGARLVLLGPTGRRAGVSFVADYQLVDDKVVLKGHGWEYIPSALPVTETYIVEAATFDGLDVNAARNYTDFRAYVLTNAIDVNGQGNSGKQGNFVIVTFLMNKLQTDDSFELRISDVENGPDGFSDDSRYIQHDNGWVTGVIPGNFSLSAKNSFWIKAVYGPADGNKRVIGLFNTANLNAPAS
jgi:hypothetical protein